MSRDRRWLDEKKTVHFNSCSSQIVGCVLNPITISHLVDCISNAEKHNNNSKYTEYSISTLCYIWLHCMLCFTIQPTHTIQMLKVLWWYQTGSGHTSVKNFILWWQSWHHHTTAALPVQASKWVSMRPSNDHRDCSQLCSTTTLYNGILLLLVCLHDSQPTYSFIRLLLYYYYNNFLVTRCNFNWNNPTSYLLASALLSGYYSYNLLATVTIRVVIAG